jgi:hypothetical protein
MKGERNRHFDKLDWGASNDVRKSATLLAFKLKVGCCPFLGDSSGLFFNGAWGSSMRARMAIPQVRKHLPRTAVRRRNLFIKKTPGWRRPILPTNVPVSRAADTGYDVAKLFP